MIESTESRTRDIPIWLTGLVLLICVVGGGWTLLWYMKSDARPLVDIPEDKVMAQGNGKAWRGALAGGANVPRVDRNADGVQPYGRNSFRVKIGNTVMLANYGGNGRVDLQPQYHTNYTAEESELITLRMSILGDPTWRDYLKVTDAQLEQLRKVPTPQSLKFDDAERSKMMSLWKAYHDGASAQKPAAEKALLAALDDYGKKNIAAYKAYEANRAAAIKGALTPDQIKMYRSAGKTPPKPAAAATANAGDRKG